MRLSKTLYALSAGVALGFFAALGTGVLADSGATSSSTAQLPLDELRTFSEVYSRIKSDYVEKVDDKTLIQNAIRGMMSGLDPHSAYLDPQEYKDLQIGTTGEFGGLGLEVGMENGFIKVVSPIDDTPAAKAGLKSGDLIIRIDDKPVKGMGLSEAVTMMRGKPGTKITLTVVREGEDKPLTVTLTRAVIQVASVKSRMLEDGFGYVRITQFQAKTGSDVKDAVTQLQKKAGHQLKGLVLDLRNNPGGVLQAAVSTADTFIRKGRIVYTKGRFDQSDMSFNATPNDALNGAPHGGPGQRRFRLGQRNRGRCAAGFQAGRDHGQPHLRQGLRTDHPAPQRWGRGEDHHRALLHAVGALHPGRGHRARRAAGVGQGLGGAAVRHSAAEGI